MSVVEAGRWRMICGLCAGLAVAVLGAGSAGAQERVDASGPPSGDDGARAVLWVEGVKNAYPRWSRDGVHILYESNRSGQWQLHVMDADGSHDRTISDGQANDELPDWSPDNRRIAFVSDRSGDKEVYVMNADGTGLRNLTRNPALDIHPYWSPDGGWILFNSTRDGGRLQLYEVRPDGSGTRRLASSDDDETCARVSPDGTRMVLLANLAEGHDDVLLRRRDGSRPVNLTDDPARDGWPTWTPDGASVVFASARAGRFALYRMRPDGGDVRQITDPPAPASDARPSVSPGGRRVLFNREVGDTIGIFVVDLPAPAELEHAFDWTVGRWCGVRRDGRDGSTAPMTMRVEPVLGGLGQLRRLEVGGGDSVYRGVALQIPDRKDGRWVRQYTNGRHGSFAALEGVIDGARSVWSSGGPQAARRSSLVSERVADGGWRRTMSVSEDGGATWRVLWIDELRREASASGGADDSAPADPGDEPGL